MSDSAMKRNVREVNYNDILYRVAQLPVSRWSYQAQDESIEHIGPMAQDFYNLIKVGDDDKTITTIDPNGVSLAAIKALYEENQDMKKRIEKLESIIEKLTDN